MSRRRLVIAAVEVGAGRLREDDLAAMGRCGDARGEVDVFADVTLRCEKRRSCVQANPERDRSRCEFIRDRLSGLQCLWRVASTHGNRSYMFAFTAEPGSKSEDALKLLASWTATLDEAGSATLPDPTARRGGACPMPPRVRDRAPSPRCGDFATTVHICVGGAAACLARAARKTGRK
jgi:hypothetical protein